MTLLNHLSAFHWVSLHSLVVLVGLTFYSVASHARKQRRHPSAAIAWVISLLLLPYLALPLYLMLGNRKIVGYRQGLAAPTALRAAGELPAPASRSRQLAAAIGLPDSVTVEQLAIHQDGQDALDSLRQIIMGASRTLDLCTFILGRDGVGDEIAQLLMQRARAGVRVRLLLDGIGFYLGGRPDLKRLASAGVQVALFVSPLRSALRGRTNLRNHRKMVIADGQWLWCGGRNLAAEYFAGEPRRLRSKPAWIDLSFALRGAVAAQAQQRFDQDWIFATQGTLAGVTRPGAGSAAAPDSGARLVASGPDQTDDTIYTLLVSGCFQAQNRILAVTPYFVPDSTLLMALTLAARRGVAVDLLLPRQSNHRLADLARHAALRELAGAGGRIWLAPHMIHAKAVLFDNDLALVGSANLDERSLLVNFELMVAFYEASVVSGFAQWIEAQQKSATRYRPRKPGLARELLEGVVRLVAFQL
ncbi:MAG: phospholipase D-like domain-containing protein [Rhodoferax sp.]|uniref:phospholipase D-like domain-containing protein n=1 Tax=Rhodoferax sp. TaxID=50421 RepID=UPI0026354B27|nr:phospholipase D-like domain-containing protein [Rhodoferax sp.]MDD5334951.1 phospholipase D-like domain-containing protein [Rhodoferax sp.]